MTIPGPQRPATRHAGHPAPDPAAVSAASEASASDTAVGDAARGGRDRILDAAITEFGVRGVAATSLKVIAATADVSQPLIVYHFGSKDGLRAACDARVAEVIRTAKLDAMRQGPQLDPLAALRGVDTFRPVLRYLVRTLGDGTSQVTALVDEMVDDAVAYMAEGERSGLVRPSEHPRQRAVVLVLWSLGLLAMHQHVERLLDVDLLGDAEQTGPYVVPVLEILTRGVLTDDVYERARGAFPQEGAAP